VSSEKRREEVVRYWWSKAEESLLSAQREIDAQSLGFAMNRETGDIIPFIFSILVLSSASQACHALFSYPLFSIVQ
jgi:hypothetical protein